MAEAAMDKLSETETATTSGKLLTQIDKPAGKFLKMLMRTKNVATPAGPNAPTRLGAARPGTINRHSGIVLFQSRLQCKLSKLDRRG